MRRRIILLGGLALAACGRETSAPPLLAAGNPVGTDPVRTAVLDASAYFARPEPNQPARAARGFANLELAGQGVPTHPIYRERQGLPQLELARQEARRALAIAPNAPSDRVVSGLRAAAEALDANDRAAFDAALPRDVFTAGPAGTLRRLSQPPTVRNARPALVGLGQGRA
jgi:hypothetical protein